MWNLQKTFFFPIIIRHLKRNILRWYMYNNDFKRKLWKQTIFDFYQSNKEEKNILKIALLLKFFFIQWQIIYAKKSVYSKKSCLSKFSSLQKILEIWLALHNLLHQMLADCEDNEYFIPQICTFAVI